jgi:hypothetical protein
MEVAAMTGPAAAGEERGHPHLYWLSRQKPHNQLLLTLHFMNKNKVPATVLITVNFSGQEKVSRADKKRCQVPLIDSTRQKPSSNIRKHT